MSPTEQSEPFPQSTSPSDSPSHKSKHRSHRSKPSSRHNDEGEGTKNEAHRKRRSHSGEKKERSKAKELNPNPKDNPKDNDPEGLDPEEVVIPTHALRRSSSQISGQCTPLKGYEDYLSAVLQEGEGHVSKEQYAMLEHLRGKYNVSYVRSFHQTPTRLLPLSQCTSLAEP